MPPWTVCVKPCDTCSTAWSVTLGISMTCWACTLFGGFLTHQTISWATYNERSDLQDQAENYRLLTGHYPELIQCDRFATPTTTEHGVARRAYV